MTEHEKKMVAPIVIAVLVVLYYIGISAAFVLVDNITVMGKCLLIMIPLALSGVMIYVLMKRIQEIRSGEEDDLSKY